MGNKLLLMIYGVMNCLVKDYSFRRSIYFSVWSAWDLETHVWIHLKFCYILGLTIALCNGLITSLSFETYNENKIKSSVNDIYLAKMHLELNIKSHKIPE